MRSLLRTPWPTFGMGLGLSVVGVAIGTARPDWGKGAEGIALFVMIFGGLLLIALSPAFERVQSSSEGVRRFKFGLRWIVAWVFFRWAFSFLWDSLFAAFEPFVGPAGSVSRFVLATLVVGGGGLLLPLYLAQFGAETIRRAAAWLGEADST